MDSEINKSGYGWTADVTVPCLACHTAHPESNGSLFQLRDKVLSLDGTTPILTDDNGFDYSLTDNSVKAPQINGYEYCNTCHTASMGDKKDNCFDCHYRGTRF